jgi:glycosyltransferase involved in cell wall biosynthesis
MVRNLRIAAVVPAHNEAHQIGTVLDTMPRLVDRIIVVDDASEDATTPTVRARARQDRRIQLVRCARRRGVGGAIAQGYAEALAGDFDIAVVMAGDGQMDPADLTALVAPVVSGEADYCKGNRFAYPGGARQIPALRRWGNRALSALTRVVSGYGHISDTQCGYTAISHRALARLDLAAIYPGYGYPNDLLGQLRALEMRVAEAPVRPRYNIGERSKMRLHRVVLPLLWLLLRVGLRRIRDGRGPSSGRTAPEKTVVTE